jgi:SAM-dependent methyltransferase
MDGQELPFHGEFDAVFSNAALHWMRRPADVISGVRRALKPGGRFVGEFGGHGNISKVAKAIESALMARGLSFELANPWYFPTVDEYRERLEAESLRVLECGAFPRPTELSTDLAGWLHTFASSFVRMVPASERQDLLTEVSDRCAPQLRSDDGRWTVDYVRLRFVAVKA